MRPITKLLLTCFKKGETISQEIEHRLWYLEEGRVDELTSYMRQRLLDYNGDTITRRNARAQTNRHHRPDPISEDRRIAKQIITKARK